jgi:vacuolar-type H+-ATPase catalytic subunit A/Vma1
LEKIIGAAIEVHRYCGPGLVESIYEGINFNVPVLEDGI